MISEEQVNGAIGLVVIALVAIALGFAIWADARAQRAHEEWEARFHAWLEGGMKGPRP